MPDEQFAEKVKPDFLYLRCVTCPLHGECVKKVTDYRIEVDTFQGVRQGVAKAPCTKCGEEIVESLEGPNLVTVAKRTQRYHEKNVKRRKPKVEEPEVKRPRRLKKRIRRIMARKAKTKSVKAKTKTKGRAAKTKPAAKKKGGKAATPGVRNKLWGERPEGAMNGTEAMVAAVSGGMWTVDEFSDRFSKLVKAKKAAERLVDWEIKSLTWLVNKHDDVYRSKDADGNDVFGAPGLSAPDPLGDRKKKIATKGGKKRWNKMTLVKAKSDLPK